MIPIADPQLGDTVKARVAEVIDSGMLADGPEVRAFEQAFAERCGVDHAVATSNGTTALHAALHALGIGAGDRVITTPFSFVASANAIRLCGAEPVFVDIDPRTFNLDPAAVEAKIEADPDGFDAILAVHLYGLPADMSRLRSIADQYDLALIEDAAQAHGASVDGQPVGSIGDVGCFSFYPTKNMTTGEGGMITTDSEAVAERAASFANHGRVAGDRTYDYDSIGHNFRMTSMAAVIGQVQLGSLTSFNEARQAATERYTSVLDGTEVRPPHAPDNREHVFHQYTVRAPNRADFREYLEDKGVSSGVYYPRPIPAEPAYEGVNAAVPAAEAAAAEVVSLPVHPGLDSDEIDHIVEVLDAYVA